MTANSDMAEKLTIDDIVIGHTLHGNNSTYTVLEFLGQGVFGKVAKCQDVHTKEMVAIKILKDPNAIKAADKEVSMLEALRVLDSDTYNLVRFYGRFEHHGLTCLAFEMLEINVFDLIVSREWEPLSPNNIRPIAKQLLVTLDGLKTLSVIHADMKMDNIMLTNMKEQPFKLKVIDFGEARYSSEDRPRGWVQPCGSRAPEVSLGNKFNEAIDVFTLGCNLAFLYLGYFLFPIHCNYQMVKRMVEILGYPPEYLLSNGVYTKLFFKEVMDDESWSTTWTLRTPEEYEEVSKTKTEEDNEYGSELKSLDDLVDAFPKGEDAEYEDRKALVDLLKGLLHPDPCLRLTPQQALQHCFITMSHLQNPDSSQYLKQSEKGMQVCPNGGSYQAVPFEDVSTVTGTVQTSMESKNQHPQHFGSGSSAPQLSNSSWCETCLLETLEESHDSNEWDHGLPSDETYDCDFPSLTNEGADSDAWCLEEPYTEGPDFSSPFENWLPNDGQLPSQNKQMTASNISSWDKHYSEENAWLDEDAEPNRPDQGVEPQHLPCGSETDVSRTTVSDMAEKLTIDDIVIGHTLHGNNSTYTVLEFLGQGVFGKVAKCQNVQTKEMVAIKILKDPNAIKAADKEVFMLEALRILDSDTYSLVKFYGRFEDHGLTCLAFEMLDVSIFDLIRSRKWEPLSPSDIRPIAKQLLVTLDGLKSLGVIHTDMKMDNIMLTNMKEQPFRLKVIDFGEARYSSEGRPCMWVQPCGSRAPEVSLGNNFHEAIDVFTLGCNLAFLYLGYFLFPIHCNYQMVKRMVEILGYPPEYLLSNGFFTKFFFKKVMIDDSWSTRWTLRTPEEYEEVMGTETKEYNPCGSGELKSLDDMVDAFPKWEDAEYEDRKALVDLLKGLLHPDPSLRLTPQQALQHSFITMSHLQNPDSSEYLEQSVTVMQVCLTVGSCQEVPPEDVSPIPDGQTTIMEPKNGHRQHFGPGSPAPQLSHSSQKFLEILKEGPDSNAWDHRLPDAGIHVFGSSTIENERAGSDNLSPEKLHTQGPVIPTSFDNWPSNDGQSPLQHSKHVIVSGLSSLDIRSSDEHVWSDGDIGANRPSRGRSKTILHPKDQLVKYDALTDIWSATRAETAASPKYRSLRDLKNRNAVADSQELRLDCKDKARAKLSAKKPQHRKRYINYDALRGIWLKRAEKRAKTTVPRRDRKCALKNAILKTKMDHERRTKTRHPDGAGRPQTLSDRELFLHNLLSKPPVEVLGFVRLVWDPGGVGG